jgi:cob(I)alamin adenosyltransferase
MSASRVPRQAPPRASRKASSVVIVNTGDGKGKSTAAFGTMLRAVARGWTVCVVQFVKSSEKWKVGEREVGTRLGVDWSAVGDGFSWDSKDLEKSAELAREGWRAAASKIASDGYRLVILDEITYPINWGWIPLAEVLETIRSRPPAVNLILTGRDAPQELIDLADTVTEMRNRKHAFDSGIQAIQGIDF